MNSDGSSEEIEQRLKEKIEEYRELHLELEMVEEQILTLADHMGEEDDAA